MSKTTDRKALVKAAKLLLLELNSHCGAYGFAGASRLEVLKVYTDGWSVNLGRLKHPRLKLDLWLDRYPQSKERRFYFGFYCLGEARMKQLVHELPRHLKPVRAMANKDFERMNKQTWLMHPALPRAQYGKPIYEFYWGKYCFYGVYDPLKSRTSGDISKTVSRAADFFTEVICSRTRTVETREDAEVYPKLERRVRRIHLTRERSPELARQCKRRDGYRCQVCDMSFEEVYGELGRGFAEAHHKHPLSRKPLNVKTRLEDLVTVCANCHRMLHLMRGREHDLEELKRSLNRQRKRR